MGTARTPSVSGFNCYYVLLNFGVLLRLAYAFAFGGNPLGFPHTPFYWGKTLVFPQTPLALFWRLHTTCV